MTLHYSRSLPQENNVITYVKQQNTSQSVTEIRVENNVVPFRAAARPVTFQILVDIADMDVLGNFIEVVFLTIRPQFPEFTIQFSPVVQGCLIQIIPNSASSTTKQRLAVLDQSIRRVLDKVKGGQKKKSVK